MTSVRAVEMAISGGVSSAINQAVAGKTRLLDWQMRSSHVSNTDPSGSCGPNSGLMRKNIFFKGARHRRRLCPAVPQLRQRPLFYT